MLLACPAFLLTKELPLKDKYEIKRNQLGLYSLHKNESGWYWRPVPLQLDPLDKQGRMLYPDVPHYLTAGLQPNDRLSFSLAGFSKWQLKNQRRLPCQAAAAVEIESPTGQFAYLTVCDEQSRRPVFDSPVHYNAKENRVESDLYQYQHQPENHFMFKTIALHDGQGFQPVATQGDQLIYANLKNFWTLVFEGSDVSAQLFESRSGPLGLVGLLKFYLDILAFRIELSLTPEVQFFASSVYMPMSLYSPVEAKEYLHADSGVYYFWENPVEIKWHLAKSSILAKGQFTKEQALQQCRRARCDYRLVGETKGESFVLRFRLPRNLIAHGFYPQFVPHLKDEDKIIRDAVAAQNRQRAVMGFFFNTAELARGNHDWDFWIHFGEPEVSCPRLVQIRPWTPVDD
jgi:hypothetical protein